MPLRAVSESVAVGTTPTLLASYVPSKTFGIQIKAGGTFDYGGRGVSVGQGIDMVSGETDFFSPAEEFLNAPHSVRNSLLELYGVASVATTARVMKIFWED